MEKKILWQLLLSWNLVWFFIFLPASVVAAVARWWIPCDTVHSSWCLKRTATSPGSFCALYPACLCSRRARAAFRLRLLRDKSDTCPRRCGATEEDKETLMKRNTVTLCNVHEGPCATSSFLPLQANCFDNGGEWAAILSGNLGDVLGLRGRIRLLWFLGGIRFSTTGVITEGAG